MANYTDTGSRLNREMSPAEVQSILKQRANKHEKNPTPAEKAMMAILDDMDLRYKFQRISFGKGCYRIFDFYLIRRRVVIEVDGGYHRAFIDSLKDEYVRRARPKVRILRFKNKEVIERPHYVKNTIHNTLHGSVSG